MSVVLFVSKNLNNILPLMEFAEYKGIKIITAHSLQEASAINYCEKIDVIIADTQLPDGTGLDLLKNIPFKPAANTEVYILGEKHEVEAAKEARRLGAKDFLSKPLTIDYLKKIFNCLATNAHHDELKGSSKIGLGDMVGSSPAMQDLYQVIKRAAPTDATIFIVGKSGTGKELVADALHRYGKRAKKTYLAINCGAISSELIGSALFGHEKGSFTGASQSHKGYFEQASGGTLFLDEITEAPLDLQVKLLRVLETSKVIPVGGKRQIEVDVRIIASTNRCPQQAVNEGVLREDLYYRLSVFPIYVPPLKERGNDMRLLAEHFLNMFNKVEGRALHFHSSALQAISKLEWRGNVRELKNLVYRAFILADNVIDASHIRQNHLPEDPVKGSSLNVTLPMGTSLRKVQEHYVRQTLKHYNYNKKAAAEALGISIKDLFTYVNMMTEVDAVS